MLYSDGGLGNDNIEMLERWKKETNGEYSEIYHNVRMKDGENRNKVYPKKNLENKPLRPTARAIAALSIVAISSLAVISHQNQRKIYDHVYETGVIPSSLSIRDDSVSGHLISYQDIYGNIQSMGSEYFVNLALQEGLEKGLNANELAIAFDYCGICDASFIKDSSFLGRIGEEIKVTWNIDEQLKEAVGEVENTTGRSL